jgi:hypothetical protein
MAESMADPILDNINGAIREVWKRHTPAATAHSVLQLANLYQVKDQYIATVEAVKLQSLTEGQPTQ